MNFEAEKWVVDKINISVKNSLLDPAICQEMVNDIHKKYDLDFSYGGWMEDRSFLWSGSYMDQKKTYIHLGLDLNVPAGTEIAATFNARVARIDNDPSFDCGWGTRVILKHQSEPIYLIYAHLNKDICCKKENHIKKGQIFAKVGKPPYNGNWFEHLHLQAIAEGYYKELEREDLWAGLDGYGAEKDTANNAKKFPDPIKLIF